MLWVALHFPSLQDRSSPDPLAPIAGWACQFTPRVSLEPPQALLAEVRGSLRYFGGRAGLLERMRNDLRAMGLEAALGAAATPRAALWIARGGGLRLEEIPIEAMGVDTGFLKSIGMHTIGNLLQLPREGLARRCGEDLVLQLDRALGAAPEPRRFYAPPPRFDARLALPAEVTHAEALLFPARRLLMQLEGLLHARQAGIRAFSISLFHEAGSQDIRIGLASLCRETKRMADLLRERLTHATLERPVEAIALHAQDFAPLAPGSRGMFGDAAQGEEDWAALAERLQARLGAEAVHGLTVCPDHRPEHAWRRVEPGEWDPREFVPPGARPAWLLAPRRLAEGAFTLLAGPERIECGWWDGDEAKRDYFVARMHDTLAWIFRENNEWFLHGLFA